MITVREHDNKLISLIGGGPLDRVSWASSRNHYINSSSPLLVLSLAFPLQLLLLSIFSWARLVHLQLLLRNTCYFFSSSSFLGSIRNRPPDFIFASARSKFEGCSYRAPPQIQIFCSVELRLWGPKSQILKKDPYFWGFLKTLCTIFGITKVKNRRTDNRLRPKNLKNSESEVS